MLITLLELEGLDWKTLGPFASIVSAAVAFAAIYKYIQPGLEKARQARANELASQLELARCKEREALHLQQTANVTAGLAQAMAGHIEVLRVSNLEIRPAVHELRETLMELNIVKGIEKRIGELEAAEKRA